MTRLPFPFAALLVPALLVAGPGPYQTTQITSGAYNHESPSINNHGDVVWSQQAGGFWQVYILHSGSTVPIALPGQAPDHNNQYPDIDDAGDVVYLKDNVGQGVALAVILNHGGNESIIQFSSINVISGQQRRAGKHFGIAGNGTTITYFDFLTFGFGPRTFVVSGVGNLAPDFSGTNLADFPDVNSNGTFVYSSFGTVYSAGVAAPNSPNKVANGDMPRIADVLPPATTPEIVYINGGGQVISTVGGMVDAGSWADVNNAGTVVYEKSVVGVNQLFLAISGPAARISAIPSSIDFGSVSPSKSKTQRFIIENTGAAGSTLAGTVMPPLLPFSIMAGAGGFSLAAGANTEVDIQFEPSALGSFSDSVVIASNDPVTPSLTVPLSGKGSNLSTVTVWIDAFIPYSSFGPAFLLPQTWVLLDPGVALALTQIYFGGDGRSFSDNPTASFRTQWIQSFDANTLAAACAPPCFGVTGTSYLESASGAVIASAQPSNNGLIVGQPQQVGSLVYVSMNGGARDGFLDTDIVGGTIPAVNANVTFRIDTVNRTAQLVGTHGLFPAFEAYVQGDNDPPVALWQRNVGPQIAWPILIQGLLFPNGVSVVGTQVPF